MKIKDRLKNCVSAIMGSKSTKYTSEVQKFNPEQDGEAGGEDRGRMRPPSGMPNPRDAPMRQNFLTVPTLVYVDDDTMSTLSAETTTLFTKSSAESSMSNLSSLANATIDSRKPSLPW